MMTAMYTCLAAINILIETFGTNMPAGDWLLLVFSFQGEGYGKWPTPVGQEEHKALASSMAVGMQVIQHSLVDWEEHRELP